VNYPSVDQELPLEVDDEYWYHPDPREAFKQPEGVPSIISGFNAWIRLTSLMQKMALVCRNQYQTSLYRLLTASTEATRHISSETMDVAHDHLAELDSALNEWLESLPSHRASSPVSDLIR